MEKEEFSDENKNTDEMRAMLALMLDEDAEYDKRLEAYEFLSEDCEPILEEMLPHIYTKEGDTGKMLMEVLSNYKGSKAVYMGLVSWLYKGDDVALFAKLLGKYGDEAAIEVLKGYLNEFETDYNEFMEIRNAVEELGGFLDFNADFSEDPLFRYLKGLDEEDDEDSRRSPFEELFFGKTSDSYQDGGCSDHSEDHDHHYIGGEKESCRDRLHECCDHNNDCRDRHDD